MWKGRHIITIDDLTREDLEHVMKEAQSLKEKPEPTLLSGHVLGTAFFEPSTRTRLSFESAMLRLGGQVLGFADAGVTSLKKGESIEDTTHMLHGYADVLVVRHPTPGIPARCAAVSQVPVINAGDGAHEHPTQTLVDLFSILETQGKIDGCTVAMVGDLKFGRTVHSLAKALSLFNDVTIHCIAPDALQMPQQYLDVLKGRGTTVHVHDTMTEALQKSDVLYMTRIQQERFEDQTEYERFKGVYVLTKNMLSGAKENMRVMHPLPRVDEIDTEVDATPHAYYFQEAHNGVFVRQALLALLLGKR